MAKSPSVLARRLPWWAPALGSLLIAFHLLAIACQALSAPSGPWPTFYGMDMSPGPQFAGSLNNVLYPNYSRPLALTSDYHFTTNRPNTYGVRVEIILRDAQGMETKRLTFPDPNANFWVRQRQQLLVQALANDVPTQQRGTDKVGPKGAILKKQDYWLNKEEVAKLVYPGKNEKGEPLPPLVDQHYLDEFPLDVPSKTQHMVLVPVEDTLAGNIPRKRELSRPSPWVMVLAKSYLRHLCDKYNAHSAELIRHSRPAVLPVYMFYGELPPEDPSFTETIAHYGDLKLDLEEVQK